jgi:hypothetical protein
MPQFVQNEVSLRRANPQEGERLELVLGIRGGHVDVVRDNVIANGGEVIEQLPFDSLLIDYPETELDALCEMPEIESIELDESMEVLSGN